MSGKKFCERCGENEDHDCRKTTKLFGGLSDFPTFTIGKSSSLFGKAEEVLKKKKEEKSNILDELLEPKDVCQNQAPLVDDLWCGCESKRKQLYWITKGEKEHQGYVKKIDAGKFIWYCSKECAVKDNQ